MNATIIIGSEQKAELEFNLETWVIWNLKYKALSIRVDFSYNKLFFRGKNQAQIF